MSEPVHARTVVYNVNYHIVWCVKYRHQIIVGQVEKRLKQILLDIAEDKGFSIKSMETMPDHVHVFASAHPKIAPGYIYKSLKGISARKLLIEFPEIKQKLWNPATYVETIGHISEDAVVKYIQDQKSK